MPACQSIAVLLLYGTAPPDRPVGYVPRVVPQVHLDKRRYAEDIDFHDLAFETT